ncbi:Inhibitor of growth protein 4 [Danaus plexippus plexippus]|uniref:Inhibitor of growth protein 4 n=2 Tax=Danaus TaxID=13036 RepID=A0A212FI64_DANPL|nr:Inhibitor of growth protein 4 [Danaus plexippus plexippus]
MIGCDSPKCTLQWYHFKCVGIVTAPDGNWYCPECRKYCNT